MENTNNLTNESFNQNIENNSTLPQTEIPSKPKQDNIIKFLLIISILVIFGLIVFIFFLLKNNTTNQSTTVETKDQTEKTTASPTTEAITPTVVQKSEVSAFKEGNSLYFLDSENNKSKIADGVSYYSLSNDKSKIAYVLSIEKSPLDPYFYIYHISDKSIEKISSKTEINPSAVDWSLNDNFLVLNYGTDVVRNAAFFDYQNKKNLFKIQLYTIENGKTVEWISDTEFLFNEPQKVNPEIPAGAGYSTNITKMSVTTKQKEVLKQGTSLVMYRIVKNNNGIIYFKKDSVADSADWFGDKESINYWQMDINGNNVKQIDKIAI